MFIPDPRSEILHPGPGLASKNLSTNNPKNCFCKSSRLSLPRAKEAEPEEEEEEEGENDDDEGGCKLSEIQSGMFIPVPGSGFFSISRIPDTGVKKHWIPDPQHCLNVPAFTPSE
jgi:hypothetical protein